MTPFKKHNQKQTEKEPANMREISDAAAFLMTNASDLQKNLQHDPDD